MTPSGSTRSMSASTSRSGQRAGQSPKRTRQSTPKVVSVARHRSSTRMKRYERKRGCAVRPISIFGRNISKPRSVRRSAANASRCGCVFTQAQNAASGMGAELSAKAESSQEGDGRRERFSGAFSTRRRCPKSGAQRQQSQGKREGRRPKSGGRPAYDCRRTSALGLTAIPSAPRHAALEPRRAGLDRLGAVLDPRPAGLARGHSSASCQGQRDQYLSDV
jgi:hypothetical protein